MAQQASLAPQMCQVLRIVQTEFCSPFASLWYEQLPNFAFDRHRNMAKAPFTSSDGMVQHSLLPAFASRRHETLYGPQKANAPTLCREKPWQTTLSHFRRAQRQVCTSYQSTPILNPATTVPVTLTNPTSLIKTGRQQKWLTMQHRWRLRP